MLGILSMMPLSGLVGGGNREVTESLCNNYHPPTSSPPLQNTAADPAVYISPLTRAGLRIEELIFYFPATLKTSMQNLRGVFLSKEERERQGLVKKKDGGDDDKVYYCLLFTFLY